MALKSERELAEKRKRKQALQRKFGQRITIARHGREYFSRGDYINASKKYLEYLGIHAEMNDLQDIYRLSPKMFSQQSQVTEALLISHIYWELARIHESEKKLEKTFAKALSQFVKFTVNQPYQVFNAEMLRKYIKKTKGKSPKQKHLQEALQQIFVQSRKCYIATHCFGTNHDVTIRLRKFKDILATSNAGRTFITLYYKASPKLIDLGQKNIFFDKTLKVLSQGPLWFFSRFFK